jgi:hypothetical protein
MITVHAGSRSSLIIDTKLSAAVAHDVAEAFVVGDRKQSVLHTALVNTFGFHSARTYAIDMSVPLAWVISFSRRIKPRVLTYRGAAASIADDHALTLKLYLSETKPVTGVVFSAVNAIRPGYVQSPS